MSSASASNITSILKETRTFPPPPAFADSAHVKSKAEYEVLFQKAKADPEFQRELDYHLRDFVGRATPLYHAERLSAQYGARIYLKREDLCHTGAHKINNTAGQILLTLRMGKKRVIAETGAGQHGVATATLATWPLSIGPASKDSGAAR